MKDIKKQVDFILNEINKNHKKKIEAEKLFKRNSAPKMHPINRLFSKFTKENIRKFNESFKNNGGAKGIVDRIKNYKEPSYEEIIKTYVDIIYESKEIERRQDELIEHYTHKLINN